MDLPKEFEAYTHQLFGDGLYDIFRHALDEEPPVSIRVNPFKGGTSDLLEKVEKQPVPWCCSGYYLAERPPFTFDPLLHAGLYYVQEASSMFICDVVQQLFNEPLMMLDLCAAPGGKTTALLSSLPKGSLLFTNEPVKTRASILKENVEKWGHPDIVVTNNFPKDYRKARLTFDAILADVPCSGEGMFRKDPNAIKEWSVQNVDKCQRLQRSIIEDIWPCLRPGGILIYSTCTYNTHEDEENVRWIMETLGASALPLSPSATNGKNTPFISKWGSGVRFIPGITKGEGLYMAVLKKDGDSKHLTTTSGKASLRDGLQQKAKSRHTDSLCKIKSNITDWLKEGFSYIGENGFVRAIPTQWDYIYNKMKDRLHIIHAGVGIGTIKGKDIIPDESLALSIALNDNAFPKMELGYENAINYLRREVVHPEPALDKGFTLVAYKGHPLGFIKNLGTRANNLYPQEWRIKSTHTP